MVKFIGRPVNMAFCDFAKPCAYTAKILFNEGIASQLERKWGVVKNSLATYLFIRIDALDIARFFIQ